MGTLTFFKHHVYIRNWKVVEVPIFSHNFDVDVIWSCYTATQRSVQSLNEVAKVDLPVQSLESTEIRSDKLRTAPSEFRRWKKRKVSMITALQQQLLVKRTSSSPPAVRSRRRKNQYARTCTRVLTQAERTTLIPSCPRSIGGTNDTVRTVITTIYTVDKC